MRALKIESLRALLGCFGFERELKKLSRVIELFILKTALKCIKREKLAITAIFVKLKFFVDEWIKLGCISEPTFIKYYNLRPRRRNEEKRR